MNKQLIRVDLPSLNGRTQHFHDTHGVRTIVNRIQKSSTGEHMAVSDYVWLDPKTKKEIRESSQWGTHFDTPYHFDKDGSGYITLALLSGPARVVDLRDALVRWSDGYAITRTVIEKWFKPYANEYPLAWQRILLRVLSDEDSWTHDPLKKFPYFADKEAVSGLLDNVLERWLPRGARILMCCTESPSVDEVGCGHMCVPGPNGNGGAHGEFYQRGVLIGENWNFRCLKDHATGFLHVVMDSVQTASDSQKIDAALFEPLN